MAEIFVSYRRDEFPHARLVYDRLRDRFGGKHFFWDRDSIEAGEDFVEALHRAIEACRVIIAVVGPAWNRPDASGRPRTMGDEDWCRYELTLAINAKKTIVPVLVATQSMPKPADLPRKLRPLARIEAVELSESHWDADLDKLARRVATIAGLAMHRPQAPAVRPVNLAQLRTRIPTGLGGILQNPDVRAARDSELAQMIRKERAARDKARAESPVFYEMGIWWTAAALTMASCVGAGMAAVPLVGWAVDLALGWLSLPGAAPVSNALPGMALAGLAWAAIYVAGGAIVYQDDPREGWPAFFSHGILGGWFLWFNEFEPGPGFAGAFPLNILLPWLIAQTSATAGFALLGLDPTIVGWAVLGAVSLGAMVWYGVGLLDATL